MKNRLLVLVACALACAGAVWAADEITATVTFRVDDGYLAILRSATSQFTITNAAPQIAGDSQGLTTNAATALTSGSLTVKGWAWFRNLDSTATVALGVVDSSTNFLEFARLKPTEYGLIRLGTNTIYGMMVTATNTTAVLEKLIVDD
ncbi:MAG: hypothetical protein ABIH03_17150 [Pseudomonadota bacterium]